MDGDDSESSNGNFGCDPAHNSAVNLSSGKHVYNAGTNEEIIVTFNAKGSAKYSGKGMEELKALSKATNLCDTENIPFEIDGNCKFILPAESQKNVFTMGRDKWKWSRQYSVKFTNVTIDKKPVNSNFIYVNCLGCDYCPDFSCPFLEVYRVHNVADYIFDKGQKVCVSCSSEFVSAKCLTRKYIAFDKSEKALIVIHVLTHSCSIVNKQILGTNAVARSEIEDAFKRNPALKPGLSIPIPIPIPKSNTLALFDNTNTNTFPFANTNTNTETPI